MAYEYQSFATLGVNLNRQNYGALDISQVFSSQGDLDYYLSNGTNKKNVSNYWKNIVPYPYEGQVVSTVINGDVSVGVIKNKSEKLVLSEVVLLENFTALLEESGVIESNLSKYFTSVEHQSTLNIERIQNTDNLSISVPDGIHTSSIRARDVVYAKDYKGYDGEQAQFTQGINVTGYISGTPKVSVSPDEKNNPNSDSIASVAFVYEMLQEIGVIDGGNAAEAEAEALANKG
jgi:hypothetical protein